MVCLAERWSWWRQIRGWGLGSRSVKEIVFCIPVVNMLFVQGR